MDLGLEGKVALITAASEGLGFACAARFAQAGCKIAICGRRPDALITARDELVQNGPPDVLTVQADIADAAAIEDLVKRVLARFGRLDILVVNSGHTAYGGLEDLTEAQWEDAYQLLLMSAVRLARLCVPPMRTNKGGDIVFLGSATMREPPPHLLLSTVMRLGVAGLSKTLSRALAPDNIRVNLVAPGYFDTGRVHTRIREMMSEGMSQAEAQAQIAGGLPVGRIGSPEELAELVAFVASRKAGFMTGTTISIDGGGGRALF